MAAVKAALKEVPAAKLPAPVSAPGAFSPDGSIWYNPPIEDLDSKESREYSAEAERLAAQGLDFSAVFAGLCQHMIAGNTRVVNAPRQELAYLFRGLIRWTRQGGKPVFKNRADWPLHFIYGGYFSTVYGPAVTEAAALAKEERDSRAKGNAFDLDDLAVTLLGGRWALKAGDRYATLIPWVGDWAWGRKKIDELPSPQFGQLAHGKTPDSSQLQEVFTFVRKAI
jgi:hypothetical protein